MASKKLKGLVIVESPAKAKKIGEYLGKDYKVMASMGHVRDLPANASEIPAEIKQQKKPWASLGVNTEADFEPLYVVPDEKKKVVRELKAALKDAQELILATDEDREGESIGWHLSQLLNPKVPVKRMVFSEITKPAILDAIANPRNLDENLVSAQETRRVLDRLYGYTLSPLLWKKISRGLSAGRVQSVAVRLLVLRELERLAFRSGKYWDLAATLSTAGDASFTAQLMTVDGKRIATGKDFDESTGKLKPDAVVRLLGEQDVLDLANQVRSAKWEIAKVEQRAQKRNPYAPFTTSTLQQEANRKLGLSARDTMRIAQRLYEDGDITYMRTDSVHLSDEAIKASRNRVVDLYGSDYLSPEARQFTTKARNAQEAHEAIRPAGSEMKTADELGLKGREADLYAMIWKRTIASQMAEARLTFQTVTIVAGNAEFRATGRHVEFAGFFRAYVEGVDDPEAALDDQEAALPPLAEGETVRATQVDTVPHETKPPARYTEATLVRDLEEDGIGRPSTYASVIGTIQDRGYVRKAGTQLIPTFTAMAVTRLLEEYFPNLVDVGFTAGMEQTLDDIAAGQAERLPYLQQFYSGAEGLDQQVKAKEETIDPRAACTLRLNGIEPDIRVGRFGPYFEMQSKGEMVTASIPATVAPADLSNEVAAKLIEDKQKGPQSLGMHPDEGLPIYVKTGPFGPYLQLGDVVEDGPKPKRVGIPKSINPETITLDQALALLSLPRHLGVHPETGHVVIASVGRFGPYVKHEKTFKSIGKNGTYTPEGSDKVYDVLTVDLPVALELLKQARVRPAPLKQLGPHPADGEMIEIYDGQYGPYVKHGKISATIPKDRSPDSVSLQEAIELIEAKAKRGPSRRGRRGAKAAPKKTTPKKTAAPDDSAVEPQAKKQSKPPAKKKKASPGKKSAPTKTGKKPSKPPKKKKPKDRGAQ